MSTISQSLSKTLAAATFVLASSGAMAQVTTPTYAKSSQSAVTSAVNSYAKNFCLVWGSNYVVTSRVNWKSGSTYYGYGIFNCL